MKAAYYELMDTDTANVVGFYKTREAALTIVRRAYEQYGLAGIEDLALSAEAGDGEGVLLGEGAELLRMAMEAPRISVAG